MRKLPRNFIDTINVKWAPPLRCATARWAAAPRARRRGTARAAARGPGCARPGAGSTTRRSPASRPGPVSSHQFPADIVLWIHAVSARCVSCSYDYVLDHYCDRESTTGIIYFHFVTRQNKETFQAILLQRFMKRISQWQKPIYLTWSESKMTLFSIFGWDLEDQIDS